jgi:hypothetical protein
MYTSLPTCRQLAIVPIAVLGVLGERERGIDKTHLFNQWASNYILPPDGQYKKG